VATTFADLEARVRGLESRAQRAEEDITAIVGTVIETRDDVKWLKRAVQALLDHNGLSVGMAPSKTTPEGCRWGSRLGWFPNE